MANQLLSSGYTGNKKNRIFQHGKNNVHKKRRSGMTDMNFISEFTIASSQ